MIITNLFSIFDPSLRLFSFSWLVLFLPLFFFPSIYFISNSLTSLFSVVFIALSREVGYVILNPAKGFLLFFGSIILFLSCLNLISMFPQVFSVTSHLLVTLPFSFSLWLGVIFYVWVTSFKSFLIHLVPVSTPTPLISFIVLVELLSSLIRPLALTFRLTANLMAGHLIMSLLASGLVRVGLLPLFLGSTILFFFTFMELGVCFIQAYVFSSLFLLYSSEAHS